MYFLWEYAAGEGYQAAENQLIFNFKKSPSKAGTPEYEYKAPAIRRIGDAIGGFNWVEGCLFVPVPPSKTPDHPDYDDRLIRALEHAKTRCSTVHWDELITQTSDLEKFHTQDGKRLPPNELAKYYTVKQVDPPPQILLIFDDVLTTGSHYKAVKKKLSEVYPDARIIGIFVSRRVPPRPDAEDFGFDIS